MTTVETALKVHLKEPHIVLFVPPKTSISPGKKRIEIKADMIFILALDPFHCICYNKGALVLSYFLTATNHANVRVKPIEKNLYVYILSVFSHNSILFG